MNTETLIPTESQEQSHVPSELMVALSEKFQQRGIKTALIEKDEIEADSKLGGVRDILVCAHQPEEDFTPTVRLYRGIREYSSTSSDLGEQVLNQRPYALKKPVYGGGLGHVKSTELADLNMHNRVATFLDSGKFEDLVQVFADADLYENDRRFIEDERLKNIATTLIKYPDRTLRQELAFHHVAAPGGNPTQDVSPFVATSLSPDKAIQHGNLMLVLDVPTSVIEGRGEQDEILVGMAIEPEWITALVEHDPRPEAGVGEHVARRLGMTGAQEVSQRETVGQVIDTLSEKDVALLEQNVSAAHKYLIERISNIFGNEAEEVKHVIEQNHITDYREASKVAGEYISDQMDKLGHRTVRTPFKEPLSEKYLSDMYETVQYLRNKAA